MAFNKAIVLPLLVPFFIPIYAVKLDKSRVFSPQSLGEISLAHSYGCFLVEDERGSHQVQNCFIDKELRGISEHQLDKLLENGHVAVNQMSDGQYSIRAYRHLNGGGPIAGAIAYWVTKSLCWGGVGAAAAAGTAAVAAATVATGGAAGVTTAVAINAGVSVAIASTGAGTVAAGSVAAAVGTSAAATGAVATAAGAVASAGGIAGVVAGIETASLAAGTAFTLMPFLP